MQPHHQRRRHGINAIILICKFFIAISPSYILTVILRKKLLNNNENRNRSTVKTTVLRQGKIGNSGVCAHNDFRCCDRPKCSVAIDCKRNKKDNVPCCGDVLYNDMQQFTRLFKEIYQSSSFFIFYGTLLGSVRNSDIVPWETDIDIVIERSIYDWQLLDEDNVRRFNKAGFLVFQDNLGGLRRACRRTKSSSQGGELDGPDKEGNWAPYIDLYWHETIGNEVSVLGPSQYNSYDSMFPLRYCNIRQSRYPCPNDAPKVLSSLYGENWRVPDPKYHKWRTKSMTKLFFRMCNQPQIGLLAPYIIDSIR